MVMREKLLRNASIATLLLGAGVAAAPAAAQTSGASDDAEIVVTARLKQETLMDIPLAVTAVMAEDLERLEVQNVDDLYGRVPGLYKAPGSTFNTSDFAALTVRGIGFNAGLEPAVGVFIDGMYQPQIGFDTAFLDLERVEILRGPQGTLFGRNTQGGAVSLVTRKPGQEFRGKAQVTVAEFGTIRARGSISGPFGETLAGSVAVDYDRSNGFIHNILSDTRQDDHEQIAIRGALRWTPTENLDIMLQGDANQRDFNEVIRGVRLATRKYESLIDNDEPDSKSNRGVQLNVDLKLADNLQLTSISGYRKSKSDIFSDSDSRITNQAITVVPGYPPLVPSQVAVFGASIDQYIAQRFVSQELRLAYASDNFDLLAGAYYFDQHQDQDRFRLVGAGVTFPFALYIAEEYNDDRDGYAFFSQASFRPLPGLELTGGLRYSDETVRGTGDRVQVSTSGGPPQPLSRNSKASFNNWSFMGSIGYEVTPSLNIYATVAEGWKAGGINRFPSNQLADLPYKEESSVNYELGLKSRLGTIGTFNLAAYYIDVTNQQLTNFVQNPGQVPVNTIDNAAASRVKGIEGELMLRPVEGLEFNGSFAYSDSAFKNYVRRSSATDSTDFSGKRFENVPKWTANASLLYRLPVGNS